MYRASRLSVVRDLMLALKIYEAGSEGLEGLVRTELISSTSFSPLDEC